MMWRQCDTFFYAYEFYSTGVNLLMPSVCWMGGHPAVALEFPVVSAVISIFFSIFGLHVSVAKLVCLIFFALSVFYMYLSFKVLYYKRLAYIIALVYTFLPLGLYYSVSVIIDFGEIFFVFGAFYHFILWLENEDIKNLIITLIFAVFGLLVKAPYIIIIILPAIYEIVRRNKIKLLLRNLVLFIIPVVIFIIWRNYVENLNSQSPDWFFIPGYHKFTNMENWYFGDLNSRLNPDNWRNLFIRFGEIIVSYAGLFLFIPGIFIKLPSGYNKKIIGLFAFGSVLYLMIFFNLNVIHDYYQIPFLAMASAYIAVTFDYLYRNISVREVKLITILISFIMIVNCIWYTERWFFKEKKLFTLSSELIKNNTDKNSLVIVSGPDIDMTDPSILAPALRKGWSIRSVNLSDDLIGRLKNEGAEYLLKISNAGESDSSNIYKLITEKTFENKFNVKLYDLQNR